MAHSFTPLATSHSGSTARGVDTLGIESDKNIWINGVVVFGPTGDISFSLLSFEFEILNERNISMYSSNLNLPTEASVSQKYTFGPVLIEADKSHTLLLKDIIVKYIMESNARLPLQQIKRFNSYSEKFNNVYYGNKHRTRTSFFRNPFYFLVYNLDI